MKKRSKITLKKIKGHMQTVHEHRKLVRQECFRLGLYYQGIVHDLSKYSPSEFLVGVRYYQGHRSPNNAEREEKGYSEAWLHHKGRNKHHYEYWLDYSTHELKGYAPARMPDRYLVEMYADRVSASKIYNKGNYTNDMPLKYFLQGKDFALIEEGTKAKLEMLLNMLANKGEEKTEEYIRKNILKAYPGAMLAQFLSDRSKKQLKKKELKDQG